MAYHTLIKQPIVSPEESANAFNDFFTSVFQQFNTDDSGTFCISDKLENFVKGKLAPDVKFNTPPVSLAFVQKQLTSLDPSKATGLDGLSAKILRLSATVIAAPLTKILNMSIATRIFPDAFKKVKVTPCFKKGDKNDVKLQTNISSSLAVKNYRKACC